MLGASEAELGAARGALEARARVALCELEARPRSLYSTLLALRLACFGDVEPLKPCSSFDAVDAHRLDKALLGSGAVPIVLCVAVMGVARRVRHRGAH